MHYVPFSILCFFLIMGTASYAQPSGGSDAASSARPVVVPAGEGDVAVAESGTRLQFKLGSLSNGAEQTMAATFTVPPGHETVTHLHEIDEETFYITEGEFTVTLGDEVFTAGPGAVVFAPPGTWMSFANRTESEASGLILLSRGETEECFRVLFSADSDEAARRAAVAQCRLQFPTEPSEQ
jgi:quercetin dioxygenase-like cupin family protein